MAKYPYKQYVRLMADRFGWRLERNRKQVALTIYEADNTPIFRFSRKESAPEVGWEEIWNTASIAVEHYTGISIFECWDDMYEARLKQKNNKDYGKEKDIH